jgi:hypothetical protein
MIADAHSRGLEVIPWTIDDPATMDYFIELGVDGIITDYPNRLREVMADNGMRLPKRSVPPAVLAEAALEEREGAFACCADLGGEVGAAPAGQRSSACEIDQRAMEGHHRLCGEAWLDVVGSGASFLGEQSRQGIRVPGDDQSLPGHEGRALAHEPGQLRHPAPTIAGHGRVGAVEDEASERAQWRVAVRPVPHRGQELVFERVHPLVDEVLLGREVVEDGLLRDIGRPRDLGDADLIEAVLEKETLGRVGDRPARLLLLPLTKSKLGAHGVNDS